MFRPGKQIESDHARPGRHCQVEGPKHHGGSQRRQATGQPENQQRAQTEQPQDREHVDASHPAGPRRDRAASELFGVEQFQRVAFQPGVERLDRSHQFRPQGLDFAPLPFQMLVLKVEFHSGPALLVTGEQFPVELDLAHLLVVDGSFLVFADQPRAFRITLQRGRQLLLVAQSRL